MVREIIQYKSNTGSTKEIHTIYDTPTSGSFADYILLKDELKKQDVDFLLENMEWQIRLFYHFNFLIKTLNNSNGNLICVYCGKQHLKIQAVGTTIPQEQMATVDHFNPKSKGGAHFDEDNMVVACFKCNNKKKDKIVSVDTLKYLDEERKQKFIQTYSKKENKINLVNSI